MLDNAVLFSLSANQDLAQEVANKLGVKLGERIIKKFPSGETIVEPVDTVRGKDVFIIQSTCPPVNENLMEVLIFVDALRRASAHEINLIVPYFGYARQDRKAKPRQPITAALVAHLLTTAGVDRVVTVNLHAAQEQGFFSCLVDDLTAVPLLGNDFIESCKNCENITVVSPDHGGVNRARDLAEMLNAPIAIIDKRRNNKLEPEVMNIIGDVKGRDCIMIDDMIDTCRSAIAGAKALRANGAKSVRMMAVHAVLSDPCYSLLTEENPFDSIIVSDSIPLSERFKELGIFRVVSLSTVIAETIDRIVNNVPLSGVYNAIGHKDSANS
ncbi:MAG: ribose-phosphate pyrophosphokinase [Bacilli bacterium]|nr:ribose-phosphate pyrophosphokinase [Bacilli bacterium]